MEQNAKLDQLEHHGRRDSLRISGIPENVETDDTDAAVLTLHAVMKVDDRFNQKKLSYHIELARLPQESLDSISLKCSTRNMREKVFKAKENIKTER